MSPKTSLAFSILPNLLFFCDERQLIATLQILEYVIILVAEVLLPQIATVRNYLEGILSLKTTINSAVRR